jgi:hypothetical protein
MSVAQSKTRPLRTSDLENRFRVVAWLTRASVSLDRPDGHEITLTWMGFIEVALSLRVMARPPLN